MLLSHHPKLSSSSSLSQHLHPTISKLSCSSLSPSYHLHHRIPSPIPHIQHFSTLPKYPAFTTKNPITLFSSASSSSNPSLHFPRSAHSDSTPLSPAITSDENCTKPSLHHEETREAEDSAKKSDEKSFWAAVGLIIGTAVGPGMLGLPSATIRSGPVPSTISIVLSWAYVVSSIILVAELSFSAMQENNVEEVSFTALATDALGLNFGAFVAVVYACLSFALLIACVSGIGSLIVQQFPVMNPILAYALAPCFVGIVIGFFPFKAIDVTNRLLCLLMLFSITALVAIGFSVGRSNLLDSLSFACWRPETILPAIPVTVLTLGFHVITPFVCKIVGNSMYDARRAILFGGAVPLAMVLSWNLVVLGLAGSGGKAYEDPIKLLLSVNASALPAVQGFAFAALATSLIGYAVSFPKQLTDTAKLIAQRFDGRPIRSSRALVFPNGDQTNMASHVGGRVGFAIYSRGKKGSLGQASFAGWKSHKFTNEVATEAYNEDLIEGLSSGSSNDSLHSDDGSGSGSGLSGILVMWIVLIVPIFIASFFRAAFARALDFAGVYANCFLFGVLPPAMAWIHRSRKRNRSPESGENLLPGGNGALIILFGIAVLLGFWH